ncbi:Putative cytochrome P450 [Septoria linicola]|uniref:Cytochrome P450 n=1 Tax=Septoria linicola TaxID=215465 RepID=A0A9Q9EJF0_9PEZI|nr:putative cytochrome P450 [Septoria linicola]USW52154.1 Putative cytochrome P450 [Septoria linicola]
MVPTTLVVAFAILAFFIVRKVRQYYALKDFGGHWSTGWSRLWLLRTQSSGQMNKIFTNVNREYGSTARIGPGMLITSDPELMKRMNAVRSTFTRGPWYAALKLHPERDNITSYIDERKHADIRNRMAPGYSGKENVHLEQEVDEKLLQMHDLVAEKYLNRPEEGIFKTVDLGRITSFFTLDVISKIAFGQPFGFLDEDEDPFGYLENLAQFLPAIIVFGVYTELMNILKFPLLKSALPKNTDKRGLGRVMGFAAARVRERFGSKPLIRQDMLGAFISKGLTQGELESETLTQITAGSDSTASSLRLTLHFVSTSPPILERLLNEARAGIAAGKIGRPVIKDSEARQLPYLQACIKEGLRVYPPVTGLLAKRVPDGGAHIEVDGVDKFAPGGTQIGWNSWGMMRQEGIFGEDVEIYRPERWLARDGSEKERARIARMTDVVSLCFGYGRFGCLGRGVATMELNKAIIETLLRFNLQPCRLDKPFDEMVVGFYVHHNMNFVVTERKDVAGQAEPGQDFAVDAGAIDGAPEE